MSSTSAAYQYGGRSRARLRATMVTFGIRCAARSMAPSPWEPPRRKRMSGNARARSSKVSTPFETRMSPV